MTDQTSANEEIQRLRWLLRDAQEMIPFSWHRCEDDDCLDDLCEKHRGRESVCDLINRCARLDGRIEQALSNHPNG